MKRLLTEAKKANPRRDLSASYQSLEIKPYGTTKRFKSGDNLPPSPPNLPDPVPLPPNNKINMDTDANLLELARKYKSKLDVAEMELKACKEDIYRLQAEGRKGTSMDADIQLRDANWRLQQLQTQYDYLQSKSAAQTTAMEKADEQNQGTYMHVYSTVYVVLVYDLTCGGLYCYH